MIEYIKNANPGELNDLLQALLVRYRELYPEWEMAVITLDKRESREAQIDRIKDVLDRLKAES